MSQCGVRTRSSAAAWVVLVAVLVGVLYPALAMNRVVAPEASLRGQAPWRSQWGPFPSPAEEQVRAATEMGTRLSLLERDLVGLAVWNPWVGGGRPGWLASAREGGRAAAAARGPAGTPGHGWTGLLALQVTAAFLSCFWMLRRLELEPWPAAIGAMCYALAGPVASHWLDWQGSALALGPLAIAVAAGVRRGLAPDLARWALVLAVLGAVRAAGRPVRGPRRGSRGPAGRGRAIALEHWSRCCSAASWRPRSWSPRGWLLVVGREPGAPVASPPRPSHGFPAWRGWCCHLIGSTRPLRRRPSAPRTGEGSSALGRSSWQPSATCGRFTPQAPRVRARPEAGDLGWGPARGPCRVAGAGRLAERGRPLAPTVRRSSPSPSPHWRPWRPKAAAWARRAGPFPVALAVAGLLLWSLLPVAARHVPYATRRRGRPAGSASAGQLARPTGASWGCSAACHRTSGAAAGLPDVRGQLLRRGAAVRRGSWGPGSGTISVSRALAPSSAVLGLPDARGAAAGTSGFRRGLLASRDRRHHRHQAPSRHAPLHLESPRRRVPPRPARLAAS